MGPSRSSWSRAEGEDCQAKVNATGLAESLSVNPFIRNRLSRIFRAAGATAAAATIALLAYAAHANIRIEGRDLIEKAAFFGFAHGIVLVCLADEQRFLAQLALCSIGMGTMLFSASVLAKALFDWNAHAAPVGGMIMIVGWLVYATDAVRR